MDRNDYDVDYDLGKEENIDPDQLMTGDQDDDLDIESLKQLISDEPYDGDLPAEEGYGLQDDGQESLFDDGFLDVDLDDPTAEPARTGYEPDFEEETPERPP